MIWDLKPVPQLFIDTRFDMYGADLVHDYQTISDCLPGWDDRFQSYQIDWVFVTPKLPLAKVLKSRSDWKVLQEGSSCIYLERVR